VPVCDNSVSRCVSIIIARFALSVTRVQTYQTHPWPCVRFACVFFVYLLRFPLKCSSAKLWDYLRRGSRCHTTVVSLLPTNISQVFAKKLWKVGTTTMFYPRKFITIIRRSKKSLSSPRPEICSFYRWFPNFDGRKRTNVFKRQLLLHFLFISLGSDHASVTEKFNPEEPQSGWILYAIAAF